MRLADVIGMIGLGAIWYTVYFLIKRQGKGKKKQKIRRVK